jgi:V/A-type H+/Na+-transporting ATPase subunit D
MLDQKLRVLRGERQRYQDRERHTHTVWRDRQTEADRLLLHAVLLGGRAVLRAAGDQPAEVTVHWAVTVGVRHPESAELAVPDWDPPCSAATVRARHAAAEAAAAAVEHAVAARALREIETELHTTALRVRSLRRHWLPRLTDTLASVEFELEEQERAETVRRRWALVR